MRSLVVLLLLTGVASAKVVMIPVIARECSVEKTWDDVVTCVGRYGAVKIEKTLPHAKLVRVARKSDAGDEPEQGGVYLFVEQNGWQLGGMMDYAGEVLSLDNPTLGTHGVYRFELGSAEDEADWIIRQRQQVYCTGTGYRCTTVDVACDKLVGGKAIETFRGTVSWQKDHLHIAGDRSHAGDTCRERDDVELFFPQ